MSDSVRPHRRQPTRLPRPWDSPGKNTGVGCHFLLQCTKVKSESEVAQSCPTLRPHGLQPTRLLRPWDFPGRSTGVGCHCLLRGCMLSHFNHAQLFSTLKTVCPRVSPGKNTGVGYHALLQGIIQTQGSNLHLFCLLYWQVGSLPLGHLGSQSIP